MSTILVNTIGPVSGSSVEVTSNLVIDGSLSASTMSGSNISDTVYSVYYGLDASGTSISTNSVCNYGINVFTGVTNTGHATKLPQPVTGKVVKIVNMSHSVLWVYPSNTGGTINNLAINAGVQIPPDGKPYEFYCIKNPLPGAWTFSSPATAQYDSGEITIPLLTGATGNLNDQGFSAANTAHFGVMWPYESVSWYYNGHHSSNFISGPNTTHGNAGTLVAFKPTTPWFGITKIKVYTNLSACAISGTTGVSEFGLVGSFGTNYYSTGSTGSYSAGDFITNGTGSVGNVTAYGSVNQVIGGTPLLTGTSVQTNIGDPGTLWGELTTSLNTNDNVTSVGDVYLGQVLYPYSNPSDFVGMMVDVWTTGYISFQMRPLVYQNWSTISNLKVRFIIEYF